MFKSIFDTLGLIATQDAPKTLESQLLEAVRDKKTDQALFFLEEGADPNWENDEGITALTLATQTYQTELIERIKSKATTKNSALIQYIQTNRQEMVLYLLRVRFSTTNPSDTDGEGSSALMLATKKYQLKVVQALLDNQADANMADNQGLTPLHWIIKNYDQLKPDACKLLTLLIRKSDPSKTTPKRETSLILAAQTGNDTMVSMVLEHAAKNINAYDSENNTALTTAIKGKYERVAETLINAGARIDLPDGERKLPLQLVKEMKLHYIEALILSQQPSATIHTSKPNAPISASPPRATSASAPPL